MTRNRKLNGVMETDPIQKNGISLKIRKSRKNLRRFLVLAFIAMFGFSAVAQDIIILKNGDEIKSLVQEIGTEYIKYKKFENQTGPIYNLAIAQIFMIRYQNGSKDVFNQIEKTVEQPRQTASRKQEDESTITCCGLKVACSDIPNMMTWEDAKYKAPKGYRLPTPEELKCMRTTLRTTKGRMLAREYWSDEAANDSKAYSVTMDDGKIEKSHKKSRLFVRYVETGEGGDGVNASQQIQTESRRDISNSETSSRNENTNNQGFVLSKKAEIIIDSYAFLDGAALCNIIIQRFENLGFCCMHREELKKNTTASITIVVHNAAPTATFRVHINDRRQNDLEVFDKKYTNWVGINKAVDKFMEDIMPFIGE